MFQLSEKGRFWSLAMLLVIATVLVYAKSANCDFINYDDDNYVYQNPYVLSGLSPAGIRWALTTSHAGFWMPVTWLSHMLDCELYGLNPAGHHITSVILHAANALLLFGVLTYITGRAYRGFVVAALFALHPLAVDPVLWVSERKELLCMFFGLLTIGAYARYVRKPTRSAYLMVLGAFALGLMSKPMLVTLPFALLLLDYWPLRRQSTDATATLARLVTEKLPLLMMSVALSLVTFLGYHSSGVLPTLQERSPIFRLSNAVVSYVAYLGKMVWPTDLAITYPMPSAWPVWQVLLSATAISVITGVAIRARKERPYLVVGWLWYLGTLVPVIGLIQHGVQSMADHYTYLPMVGIYVALVWLIADVVQQQQRLRWPAITATAAVLVAFSCVSWVQAGHWKDSFTVFGHAIAVTTNNSPAHHQLGVALGEAGDYVAAQSHFEHAIKISPHYSLAHVNLGSALARQKQWQDAAVHFAEAARLKPDDASAQAGLQAVLAHVGGLRIDPEPSTLTSATDDNASR